MTNQEVINDNLKLAKEEIEGILSKYQLDIGRTEIGLPFLIHRNYGPDSIVTETRINIDAAPF